jgi:TolB-like protein
MRQLLLIVAVALLALGCADRTVTTKDSDKDIQVKDGTVRIKDIGFADRKDSEKPAELPSLAVLPLKALPTNPPNPSLPALADALTDSITRTLSRNEGLDVRAKSVVNEWKHNEPQAAGRQLKVKAVLSGDVKIEANKLVVSLELIEVATGRQLWGQAYKEPYEGEDKIKEVEEKILKETSEAVATKLGAKTAKKENKKEQ